MADINVTFLKSVTSVLDSLETQAVHPSEVIIDSDDSSTTATLNITNASRVTRTNISNITVTTTTLSALKSRGCTDGGNTSGINFGFQGTPAFNTFLSIPVPQHEVSIPSRI